MARVNTHRAVRVQQRVQGHPNVIKRQLGVIDAVGAHLMAHIVDRDARHRHHRGMVPDPDQESVDPLVATADQQLGKHHRPVRVDGAVCDPIFLSQRRRRVDHERSIVERRRGLHADGVVSIPGLRQPKAPDVLERVDPVEQQVVMLLRPELQDRSTEQIILDRHLRGHRHVGEGGALVCGKDAHRAGEGGGGEPACVSRGRGRERGRERERACGSAHPATEME